MLSVVPSTTEPHPPQSPPSRPLKLSDAPPSSAAQISAPPSPFAVPSTANQQSVLLPLWHNDGRSPRTPTSPQPHMPTPPRQTYPYSPLARECHGDDEDPCSPLHDTAAAESAAIDGWRRSRSSPPPVQPRRLPPSTSPVLDRLPRPYPASSTAMVSALHPPPPPPPTPSSGFIDCHQAPGLPPTAVLAVESRRQLS